MSAVARPLATANPQQQAAIEARGETFVSAGAGTGKTTVLVERFARSVVDDGLDVDSLLVITYTDRAAGELRARIRARLLELDRPDLARDLDGAWISTIHGFCRRLLTAYPLAAGIDPRFRVLDEAQARVLQGEAFTVALEEFCAADEPDRWQLLATYGARRLRSMLVSVYDTLRSAGRDLVLEPGVAREPRGCDRRARSQRPRRSPPTPQATDLQRARRAGGCSTSSQTTRLPERLLEPRHVVGAWCASRSLQRGANGGAARSRSRSSPRATASSCRRSSPGSRRPTPPQRTASRRSTSRISSCAPGSSCARTTTIREAEQLRFRSIMVDEFQDTNRLQTELIDLVCAGPAKEMFFVGDEFQSIYGFRHADVAVFRERREAAPHVLPLTLNYRSRPEVLAAVNELFAGEFGDELPAARAGSGLRRPRVRHAGRAARHRQGVVCGLGAPLAAGRGASRRPARARARRRGRRDAR